MLLIEIVSTMVIRFVLLLGVEDQWSADCPHQGSCLKRGDPTITMDHGDSEQNTAGS